MKPIIKGQLNTTRQNIVKSIPVPRVGVKPAPKINQVHTSKIVQKAHPPRSNASASSGGCLCGK